MTRASLTLSSKNYSSWSLRGWLLCRMAGLEFEEEMAPLDDPDVRAELLLLAPSMRVPLLTHGDITVWDSLAIAEYLAEVKPKAGILPKDRAERAHCRAISGEVHSGFQNLRSALPMNVKARYEKFKIFTGALPDIERIQGIWDDCFDRYGGPFLFRQPTLADAMFAPVATRFTTYDVTLTEASEAYRAHMMDWALMREWRAAAEAEPDEIEELEVEF
ncbi:MAG: glutathione S-transferase family protein [Pseudomonadota bacterium]